MNILQVGFFGHSNVGDESYKLAFPLLAPQNKFTFTDSLKNKDLSLFDLIILGGGDVVKTNFTKYLHNIDTPAITASVTITKGSDLENLSLFKKVIVRDELSFNLARQYNDNVSYLPDFSFILTPDPIAGRKIVEDQFAIAGHTLTEKFVVVVLNSYIAYNSNEALARDSHAFHVLVDRLAKLIESQNYSVIFVPFSTQPPYDDRSTNSWLSDRCKEKYSRNVVIYDKLSVQKTLDVISSAKVVISSRLHSSIFSTIAAVPFIDILHHDKNYGFARTLGVEDRTTWLWAYEDDKVRTLLEEFLTADKPDQKLNSFTLKSREELLNASPHIFNVR